jgi:hypothetical protein
MYRKLTPKSNVFLYKKTQIAHSEAVGNINFWELALRRGLHRRLPATKRPFGYARSSVSYADSLTYVSNSSVTVTPTSADPNATIQASANGGPWSPVASGTASSPFTLVPGLTTLQVQVTAQNGVTIQTYSTAITSMAAPLSRPNPPAVSVTPLPRSTARSLPMVCPRAPG